MSDYIHMAEIYDSVFDNVVDGALANVFEPPQKWANLDDCGIYPCTAPKNVLMNFFNTSFVGITPSWAVSEF